MRTRVSVYALALHDDLVLLTQLADHTYRPGCWTLPGGTMDHGEQPVETLVREAYEETGLHAEGLELFHAESYSESERGLYIKVQLVYTAHMRGAPRVVEVGGTTGGVAWVPRAQVPSLPTVPLLDSVMQRVAG